MSYFERNSLTLSYLQWFQTRLGKSLNITKVSEWITVYEHHIMNVQPHIDCPISRPWIQFLYQALCNEVLSEYHCDGKEQIIISCTQQCTDFHCLCAINYVRDTKGNCVPQKWNIILKNWFITGYINMREPRRAAGYGEIVFFWWKLNNKKNFFKKIFHHSFGFT